MTQRVDDVITVPIQAVTTRELDEDDEDDDDLIEVVFVHSGDTVAMRQVETGIQDDEYIEIRSGLKEEEEIVAGPYTSVAKELEEGDYVYKKEKEEKDKK